MGLSGPPRLFPRPAGMVAYLEALGGSWAILAAFNAGELPRYSVGAGDGGRYALMIA